jgi:hypothetical protein
MRPTLHPLATLLISSLIAISSTALAQSRNSQALSPAELGRINNQPLAAPVGNPGKLGNVDVRKPTFEYTDPSGTQVREFRDANAPTEVKVKGPLGTYEMSSPTSVMPGPNNQSNDNLLSVPSISVSF